MIGYEALKDTDRMTTSAEAYRRRQRRRNVASLPVSTKYQLESIFTRQRLFETAAHMRAESGDGSGPDGIQPTELTRSELGTMAGGLARAIEAGSYHPGPTCAVEIRKDNGGTRTLLIPNFSDRVVAKRLLEVLQTPLDSLFLETSYGFRPRRGAWQMLATLKAQAEYHGKWVIVNCDVRRAFDSIKIDYALRAFEKLFAGSEVSACSVRTQQQLLDFINNTLQGGDAGRCIGIRTGCPFSPLALNALLHIHHDELFQTEPNKPLPIGCGEVFRYADNIVHLVNSVPDGRRVLRNIRRHLLDCELELKDDAEVFDLRNGVRCPRILGFEVRRRDRCLVFELPDDALHQFAEHLEHAYRKPYPALAARQIAQGWVSWIGPAVDSGWDLLPQVAKTLDVYGFRDSCTLAELDEWAAAAWRRPTP